MTNSNPKVASVCQSKIQSLAVRLSLIVLSLLGSSMPVLAQDAQEKSPPTPEMKQSTQSILRMAKDLNLGPKPLLVKVPSYNYAGILQELQINHAKFLLPGAEIPATAKIVLQLESEQPGLRQMLYFL